MAGTPARVRAYTRGHARSADPFALRDLRGRPGPRSPSLPASDFDGKEEAVGSSPTEGFKGPANHDVVLPV
jgi:hypothetical protein